MADGPESQLIQPAEALALYKRLENDTHEDVLTGTYYKLENRGPDTPVTADVAADVVRQYQLLLGFRFATEHDFLDSAFPVNPDPDFLAAERREQHDGYMAKLNEVMEALRNLLGRLLGDRFEELMMQARLPDGYTASEVDEHRNQIGQGIVILQDALVSTCEPRATLFGREFYNQAYGSPEEAMVFRSYTMPIETFKKRMDTLIFRINHSAN